MTIDREVAALDFNGAGFRKGIDGSLQDLTRLKSGLRLGNAVEGMSNLERTSKRLDFNPMAKGIQSVTARLSTMGVIGATIVNRLVNSVIDGTKRIFSSLVTTPMKQGLEEYETQMNAIQTILANTSQKGTLLSDVNLALDELNTYADRTIYNFTNMTDSIGKFTAAGVDLDTSVGAIKGIANLAAVSGSSSAQASTAMYQLSQAIASGSLKLQDWNSVVNAGMGGEIFQNALKETARVHGVSIDSIIDKNNGFRGSLQEGWITTDILLQTLEKFTGDLNVEQLKAIGYTQDQIVEIQKLGTMANAAATDIKTLSQLKDTVSEAMQSGWAQTWRIIFGDFDEAKKLFGGVGEVLGSLIGKSADARNNFFQQWADLGGRDVAIHGMMSAFEGLTNLIDAFKSAIRDVFKPLKASDLADVTRNLAILMVRFRESSASAERFKSIVRGIASVFSIIKMFLVAILSPLLNLSGGLFDLGDGFIDILASGGDWLYNLRNMIEETDYFGNVVANLISWLKTGRDTLLEWLDGLTKLEPISDIISLLGRLDGSTALAVFNGLKRVLIGVAYAVGGVVLGLRSLGLWIASLTPVKNFLNFVKDSFTYDNLKSFLNDMKDKLPIIGAYADKAKKYLKKLADTASDLFKSFKGNAAVKSFIDYINSLDGSRLQSFFSDMRANFSWLPGVLASIGSGVSAFVDKVKSVLPDMTELGDSVSTFMSGIFDYLNNPDGKINFTGLANVIGAGLLGAVALSLKKIASGDFLSNIWGSLFGDESSVSQSVIGAMGALEGALTSWQNNLKADTIQKIAIAIGIVAASALALSLIDSEKLTGAVVAMGALMVQLFGGAAVLSKMSFSGMASATAAVIGLSLGLLVLSIAVKAFSSMDPEELKTGLLAIGIALTGFIVAIKALSLGPLQSGMLKVSAAFVIFALGMLVMAAAIKKMGAIPADEATDGLIRIGVALASFIAFAKLTNGAELLLAAAAILGMAGSIIVLSEGLQSLGALSWDTISRGLVALAGALAILVVAVKLMSGAVTGAIAIIVVSAAVLVLASAMTILGALSWEQIAIALVAMAGVFVVFGLAGLILGPLVPVLLGLGVAMLLIGVAALAVGAGIALAALGLILLAGSATLVVGAITLIGGAISLVLPTIATAFAQAIANFFITLAETSPLLLEAGKTLILTLVRAVVETTPQIVMGLLTMIGDLLAALAEKVPEFVESGFALLLGILHGIDNNIEEVIVTALSIITKFIDGLTEGIPLLVEAGVNFVTVFLGAILTSIGERLYELVGKGMEMGAKLVKGLVKGVNEKLGDVVSAAIGLAQAALDAFSDIFQFGSPSKVTTKMGIWVVDGLVISMRKGIGRVVDATSKLATKSQNGIKSITERIRSLMDDSLDTKPVITPILDPTQLHAGLAGINGSLSSDRVLKLSGKIKKGVSGDTKDVGNSINGQTKDGTVVYNQYNYSPKALTGAEIYRKTNSQLAKVRDRYKVG